MSPTPDREEELFAQALALPPDEHRSFLERECAGDAALLRRVSALLQSEQAAEDFLEKPAPGTSREARSAGSAPEEMPGSRIGRYKLLQKIGEGGCGVVYMAEQEEPIRRRVALKVIKLGMDTKEVIARFESERQALALMDHPNVARVLDAGATDAGRPFFVMELVRGVKITTYCDENRLSTAARLELFGLVCSAVQHAHQKGIIHRDLKPSNILVTEHDGAPVPKVIDFGIAKATQGRLTDRTLFTAFEQFIGTPAYMSPEQATLTDQDIDTRSDIYSLGVLLYELLTGQPPFDPQTLVKAGLDEMRRMIREVEPPRPSACLRTLTADTLTAAAQCRQTEPPRLINGIRGDLDWIVMRCLEKSRNRRYETASELARDLERHLHNDPVVARPPSTLYRLQKLVRRNKLVVGAAAAIAAALLIGTGVALAMYAREHAARERAVTAEARQEQLRQQADGAREQAVAAEAEQRKSRKQAEAARQRAVTAEEEQRRQREQAEQARDRETQQRSLAEAARASEAHQRAKAEADRKMAETETARSQQIAQFLAEMLKSVGPSVAMGRDTKLLREILDKTAARLESELKDQPEIAAALGTVLGETYNELGDYEKAEALLRAAKTKALAVSDGENRMAANLLHDLAGVRFSRGDFVGAEAFSREALNLRRRLFGNEDSAVAASLIQLGALLVARGDLAGAETAEQDGLAIQRKVLGSEDPEIASSLAIMAITRAARGDLPGAEALSREALAIQLKQGKDRYETTVALFALGAILAKEGDKDGAEALYRETLTLQRKMLGSEHPNVATTLNFLGILVWERGDLSMAETYYREALVILRRQFSDEHPEVAEILINLGMVLTRRRDFVGAEKLVSEEVAILRKVFGPEHPLVGKALACLGANRMAKGDGAAAEAPLREALAIRPRQLGNDHPDLAELRFLLAVCSFQQSDWAGAEANLLETLRIAALAPAGLTEVRDASTKLLAVVYTRWAKKDPTKTELAARWTKQWQEVEKAKADKASVLRAASSQVKYANTQATDSAFLQAIVPPWHLGLPPFVRILRIDGALIETGWFGINPFQVFIPPGRRQLKIGVTCSHLSYTTCAKETLEVDFTSGKKYNLTADPAGDEIDLKLWDATQGLNQQTLLKTWRLTGNRDITGYMTHLRD